MSFKPLDDRQVVNREALSNIGTPANDTLDDIFNKINAALGGLANAPGYISKEVPLASGITSYVVTIPDQTDTSYVAYAMLENLTDSYPQFQQPMIKNKTTTGFTVEFNVPLSSANYILSYTVPFKSYSVGESFIGTGVTSDTVTLPIPENGSNYGLISLLENNDDTYLQFQTSLITSRSSTSFTSSLNVPTADATYKLSYMLNATGVATISMGSYGTSIVIPISFGTNSYSVIAVMENTVDPYPLFQPLLLTGKTNNEISITWNVPLPTSNYVIYYYVVTLTP